MTISENNSRRDPDGDIVKQDIEQGVSDLTQFCREAHRLVEQRHKNPLAYQELLVRWVMQFQAKTLPALREAEDIRKAASAKSQSARARWRREREGGE